MIWWLQVQGELQAIQVLLKSCYVMPIRAYDDDEFKLRWTIVWINDDFNHCMIPLSIMWVCHAVPGCWKGNATNLERPSCDDQWLIGCVCLWSGHWNCEERKMISVPLWTSRRLLIGSVLWCGALVGWTIHPLVVLVSRHVQWAFYEEWCVMIFIGFLLIGVNMLLNERVVRLPPLEVFLEFCPREQGCCKWLCCNLCC